jgi:hypothetical protein
MNRFVIRLFFDYFNRADKRYSLILEKGCLDIPFLIYYAIKMSQVVPNANRAMAQKATRFAKLGRQIGKY